MELTAFDAGGGILGSVVAPLAPLGSEVFRFVGITSDTAEIAGVEFRSLQGETADDFVLDDFYFGAVPEPAALSLLTIGGLLVARRRR